jgi:hypothetical protein
MVALRDKPTQRAQAARDKESAALAGQLEQAQGTVDAAYAKWDQANKDAIAEATYGTVCNRGPTWGPCAQALADQAASLKAELDSATGIRDSLQAKLVELGAAPLVPDPSQEAKALDDALRNQQILMDNLKGKYDRISANTGLAAQIEAEWSLGGAMKGAHLVLLLVFFFIEILPVLVQFLHNMRSDESHYEHVCRISDEESTAGVEARREAAAEERQIWLDDHRAAFQAGSAVQVRAAEHAAKGQLANQVQAIDKLNALIWAEMARDIDSWAAGASAWVGDELGPAPGRPAPVPLGPPPLSAASQAADAVVSVAAGPAPAGMAAFGGGGVGSAPGIGPSPQRSDPPAPGPTAAGGPGSRPVPTAGNQPAPVGVGADGNES